MSLVDLLGFLGGLVLLVVGADLMVRGASRLAVAVGISPLVVGLTVVALGTSSPELAVSIGASLDGSPDLAMGNVVGSNIANILLILGLSATVVPLVVRSRLVRLDVPLMIAASVGVLLLGLDGAIGRIDGLVLVSVLVVYVVVMISRSRGERPDVEQEFEEEYRRPGRQPLLDVGSVVAGLALLVGGSEVLVGTATTVAERLGVSELVIGLTLVAFGTSLPEVATSLIALARGERDIAVGNAVGSNIFNLLAVLGVAAVIAPDGVAVAPGALDFDLPVMVAVAVACLPIFFTGHRIARWEGALFLGYYLAYLLYLLLDAAGHDALDPFSKTMIRFVVPLTLVGVVAGVLPGIRRPARSDR